MTGDATTEERLLHRNVERLHGPEDVPYAEDELVVVCIVRDGRPYVKSFIEHYFSLGVKHIFFLDNNSGDGTIEALRHYDGVTVLRTDLSYKAGNGETREVLFKQYLIERFGKKNRWCLCADIDELFDYPYSEIVSLSSLLRYLDSKSYTAVAAQMLDMFPEKPLSGQTGNKDEPLKELHRFYDLSNFKRVRMKDMKRGPNIRNNTIGSDEIEAFRGGVLDTLFDTNPFRTKFPLVLRDGKTKPLDGSSHWVGSAHIADFTGVLFHYKLLDERFQEQALQAVREGHRWRNSAVYKRYLEVLEESPTLHVKRGTADEIESVNDLLENRLLVVSEDYLGLVDSEDKKSTLETSGGDEPGDLDNALLEARHRERSKALKIQRLEQQLLEDQRSADLEAKRQEKVKKRRQAIKQQANKELEQQAQEIERLAKRLHTLKLQLEKIEASRSWKLLKFLQSVKSKLPGIGKRST